RRLRRRDRDAHHEVASRMTPWLIVRTEGNNGINVPLERRRGGSCFNRATTARHSSANAGWSGARRGELTRDGVEQVGQVGADKPDRHDNGDGDQGDNQSVLNGGGPALLVLETVAQGGDEVGQSSHGLYSLGRAGAGEGQRR